VALLLVNTVRCRGLQTLSRSSSFHAIFRHMTSGLLDSAGTKCHISWNLMRSGKQSLCLLSRTTTCLVNLEVSGNFTAVREKSGNGPKVREMLLICKGKSCLVMGNVSETGKLCS